jgi:hypothetical protein
MGDESDRLTIVANVIDDELLTVSRINSSDVKLSIDDRYRVLGARIIARVLRAHGDPSPAERMIGCNWINV